jgi:hypothetical protein
MRWEMIRDNSCDFGDFLEVELSTLEKGGSLSAP